MVFFFDGFNAGSMEARATRRFDLQVRSRAMVVEFRSGGAAESFRFVAERSGIVREVSTDATGAEV